MPSLKTLTNFLKTIIPILIGVLGILVIKSLFEDDNSKIVSKRGNILLSDDDKMKDIGQRIEKLEGINQHQEILI